MSPLNDLVPTSEAARIAGLSASRIIQLARSGHLPVIETKLGRLFEREAVEDLARARAERLRVAA